MRAFLAIKLHSSSDIKTFYEAMKQTNGNFKPVNLDQLHLTLKFFGDIDEAKQEEISSVVRERTRSLDPFSFRLAGCGAFPNENYLKVIWVGCLEAESLKDLGNTLQMDFAKLGFRKDNFSPHLTLFRVRSQKNKNAIQAVMAEHRETDFGEGKVGELLLISSKLTSSGPIYSVVERFPLGKES
jgi:RNA 2',3'-cyclic 3'-phosphodiesterase